jgi:hypothetical protein
MEPRIFTLEVGGIYCCEEEERGDLGRSCGE